MATFASGTMEIGSTGIRSKGAIFSDIDAGRGEGCKGNRMPLYHCGYRRGKRGRCLNEWLRSGGSVFEDGLVDAPSSQPSFTGADEQNRSRSGIVDSPLLHQSVRLAMHSHPSGA